MQKIETIEIPLSEVVEDTLHQVEHGDAKLIVIRTNEKVFAFHDRCPHAFWPLSIGTLRNTVLECAGHGWEFDMETGNCLTTPGYCLTPVAASVDGDKIRLELTDNVP
jgi:nitrite reductase/ring-hydroxylating ferredoxin subunit